MKRIEEALDLLSICPLQSDRVNELPCIANPLFLLALPIRWEVKPCRPLLFLAALPLRWEWSTERSSMRGATGLLLLQLAALTPN